MHREILLIVEDNQVLREGLDEMLGLEGFAVYTAANGREALEKMSAIQPDLILSDIAMPVMDGFEFFRAVRSRPEWLAIPFIFLTARGEKEDVLSGKDLGAEDYLIKPLSREELLTAVRARLTRSRQLRMAQLQRAYENSLTVLANAIEVRDQYPPGHVERVMAYTLTLAEGLGWRGKQLQQLRLGAILHDIGKIHISETTLCKTQPLTAEELAEIRLHPLIGVDVIKDVPYLAPAVPVVRYHHERWNGQGYPEGLAGVKIPLAARLVAVADSFEAMTTDRPYRQALSAQAARAEILNQAGAQFDPVVAATFLKAWEDGKIQAIFAARELPAG